MNWPDYRSDNRLNLHNQQVTTAVFVWRESRERKRTFSNSLRVESRKLSLSMGLDHRKAKVKALKPTERQKRMAEALREPNIPIRTAMLKAGYSVHLANRGIDGIPKVVMALLAKECGKDTPLLELGAMDVGTQEHLVRGRLAFNTIRGRDGGVQSAYRLGMDKRLGMFQPESQVGVIVVTGPTDTGKLLSGMDLEKNMSANTEGLDKKG